jgi:quercetin dioxygenase-like cupin family protein
MMKPTTLHAFGLVTVLLGIAMPGRATANATTLDHRDATVLSSQVAVQDELDHKKLNVLTVELPPGAVESRHFHPGVELLYVVGGRGQLQVDGEPAVSLDPGTVAALRPKPRHLLTNTSQTESLKLLVLMLAEDGQGPVTNGKREVSGKPQGRTASPKANGKPHAAQQTIQAPSGSRDPGLIF